MVERDPVTFFTHLYIHGFCIIGALFLYFESTPTGGSCFFNFSVFLVSSCVSLALLCSSPAPPTLAPLCLIPGVSRYSSSVSPFIFRVMSSPPCQSVVLSKSVLVFPCALNVVF